MAILEKPVSITALGSVSALGMTPEEIWRQYKNCSHRITRATFSGKQSFAAFLPAEVHREIELLRNSDAYFDRLDPSVLYAIFSARQAMKNSSWQKGEPIGINIGSSRGATQLFEQYHKGFLEKKNTEPLASPSTTLGNISSWVAQDLQSSGPEISHSVTCSTGLHSILNGIAWLKAGFCKKFLAGGSEAALTPFTIAQMQAMKIYARTDSDYPCQALRMDKKQNSMVLGEGAAVFCLENEYSENALAQIKGIGFATEELSHSVSLSPEGHCLQKAMRMALGDLPASETDIVVMHAPGTIKGDAAEINAVKAVFGKELPALTTNKWKLGHSFGASGALSLEFALLMLLHQEFIPVPFSELKTSPKKINNILVNAVGFGGNAVSLLLSKNS